MACEGRKKRVIGTYGSYMDNKGQVSFEYLVVIAFIAVVVAILGLLLTNLFSIKSMLAGSNKAYVSEMLKMIL
jgi:uncharacterized protein (UPF0333 family)